MAKKWERLQVVTVQAVCVDGLLALYGPGGRRITRWMSAGQVAAEIGPEMFRAVAWQAWAEAMVERLSHRNDRQSRAIRDPWWGKVEAWRSVLRQRAQDRARERGPITGLRTRQRETWEQAVILMQHQAHNRARKFRVDPWLAWAQGVANNSNKRQGASYGPKAEAGDGNSDHGEARLAGAQVCVHRG